MRRCGALLVAGALLTGCSTAPPSVSGRLEHAAVLAATRNWSEDLIHTPSFEIATFFNPVYRPHSDLVIYIEGDGLAYYSPERISDDPTPTEPVALELALAQPDETGGAAAYLARPCQYTGIVQSCRPSYWTEQRFAPDVIASMNDAVSQLKRRFRASRLTLVGYSGGAAVAALVAERRDDVIRLVSVAGNLSTRRWTELQLLSPLSGSLDPYDQRARLVGISQFHFVGSSDSVVPASLTEQFVQGLPDARVVTLDGFDHVCCWATRWPNLWRSINP